MGLWQALGQGREARRNRRAARAAARQWARATAAAAAATQRAPAGGAPATATGAGAGGVSGGSGSGTRAGATVAPLVGGGAAPAAGSAPRPGGAEALRSEVLPVGQGDPARGRALVAGRLWLADGQVVLSPGASPWEALPPTPRFAAALHGHDWLGDLAALGGRAARAQAQGWVGDWIARHGEGRGVGRGPGWTPALAGRRLRLWLSHAPWLLSGPGRAMAPGLVACAGVHAGFLARRWPAAPPDPERFEALAGLVLAGLALERLAPMLPPALAGLAAACDGLIDVEGGMPERNPEALLTVFGLLTTVATALRAAGREPDAAHAAAIARTAATLKALRHADGGLARFHGGGAAAEGALDLALAEAGVRARARPGRPMGFVRLASRRTTVIVDAAPPPPGPDSHASTLAFELTSGRRPLIVSAGPGHAFGAGWRRQARATAAHATLVLEGASSSRLGPAARRTEPAAAEPEFVARPRQVTLAREGEGHAAGVVLSHDGWAQSHGLVHVRRLALSADGRALMGEDALLALTPVQRRRFEAVRGGGALDGIGFALRFPIHPDVEAALEMGGRAVALRLKSGEVWIFRPEGALPALEPTVYLDPSRARPRPALAIVLPGRALSPAQQIGWTLAKAEDSPVGLRDIALDEEAPA